MKLLTAIVNTIIKYFFRIVCRVKDDDLDKVPKTGPLILIANHINSIEVPLVYTHLMPRPIRGIAKIESWGNPFFNFLFNLWKAIPIRRGEADLNAYNQALEALKAGEILVVSPEGTRSYDGKLIKGRPGAILLAQRSGAPILPLVYWGNEAFWENVKHLKRTDFNIRVGTPFKLNLNGAGLSREVREKAADELMYQLAALLPEDYRGIYSNLKEATEDFLVFEPGIESNLKTALSQS